MPASWVHRVLDAGIYFQAAGAFVWLFVLVVLECVFRRRRARANELDALLVSHSQKISQQWEELALLRAAIEMHRVGINQVRLEMNLPALSDRPTQKMPEPEEERTDRHFRPPSGLEHEVPAELVQLKRSISPFVLDDPCVELMQDSLESEVRQAHWQCLACKMTCSLEQGGFKSVCSSCGGHLELVTYHEQGRGRQIAAHQ